MKDISKKGVVVTHPYYYTKSYLNNRITASENRIIIQILKQIKHFQYQKQVPKPNAFQQVDLYFNSRELVVQNDVDRLENILGKLRSRNINLPSKRDGCKTIITMGIISKFERKVKDIGTNKGKVYIAIEKDLYAYMCNLTCGYTSFLEDTAFKLRGSYAIKMYYHICHWFNLWEKQNSHQKLKKRAEAQSLGNDYAKRLKAKTSFSVEEFREEFQLSEKYRNSDIKRRILDVAKRELDDKSEVSFNYKVVKEGQRITAFSFVFYKKSDENIIDRTEGFLSENEQEFLDSMSEGHNFSIEQKHRFLGLIKKFGINAITFTASVKHKEIQNYEERKKIDYTEAIGYILEGELQKGISQKKIFS